MQCADATLQCISVSILAGLTINEPMQGMPFFRRARKAQRLSENVNELLQYGSAAATADSSQSSSASGSPLAPVGGHEPVGGHGLPNGRDADVGLDEATG